MWCGPGTQSRRRLASWACGCAAGSASSGPAPTGPPAGWTAARTSNRGSRTPIRRSIVSSHPTHTAARPRAGSGLEALKALGVLQPLRPVAVAQVGRGQRVGPRAVYQVGQAENFPQLAVEHTVLALPVDAARAVGDRGHAVVVERRAVAGDRIAVGLGPDVLLPADGTVGGLHCLD